MSRVLHPLFTVLLLGGGLVALMPPDSAAQAPPSVERVRERIQVLRGGPEATAVRDTSARQALPTAPAAPAPPARGSDAVSERELREFEERLVLRVREVVRRQLALDRRQARLDQRESDRFQDRRPSSPAAAPSIFQYYYPTPSEDTTRAAPSPPPPSPPDTSRPAPRPRPADSVQQPAAPPPDTVVQNRVVQVRRSLLEAGLFRGFEVNFSVGESALLPRAERSLDAVGRVLQQYPSLRLEIAGHTDAMGSADSNQTLSEARATAVREYLVNQFAISPDRLEARGYGETAPVASNNTSVGRELNRRVEFVVLNPEAAERILNSTESPEE